MIVNFSFALLPAEIAWLIQPINSNKRGHEKLQFTIFFTEIIACIQSYLAFTEHPSDFYRQILVRCYSV